MSYIEMSPHRVYEFQVLIYTFIFQLFVWQSNHINQIRHVQQFDEPFFIVNIPLILFPCYNLHCMYNLCCMRTIYAKYSYSTTKFSDGG